MKLEIGMYVRTIDGIITKIIDNRDNVIIKTDDYTTHLRSKVIKASRNIIDILEVGDYVNGIIVNDIVTDIDGTKTFNLFKQLSYFGNEDIKSIVTKEMFENMKYKIGD